MGQNLDRLIAVGDIVIFMPTDGRVRAIKNLTVGKEYFVERVIVRDTDWRDGKPHPVSPYVDTVNVTNDKGAEFGYSAKHFLIAGEGVHFSMEKVEQLNRQEFLDGLRDL